jgi:hypothetical protein
MFKTKIKGRSITNYSKQKLLSVPERDITFVAYKGLKSAKTSIVPPSLSTSPGNEVRTKSTWYNT